MTGTMRITVDRRGEPIEVDAIDCGVPGLAIHPAIDAAGLGLTHVPSGRLAGWWPEGPLGKVTACAGALGRIAGWDTPLVQTTASMAEMIMAYGGFISIGGSAARHVYYSRDPDGALVENDFSPEPEQDG